MFFVLTKKNLIFKQDYDFLFKTSFINSAKLINHNGYTICVWVLNKSWFWILISTLRLDSN